MPKAKYLGHEYDIASDAASEDVRDSLSSLFPEVLTADVTTDKNGDMQFRVRGGTKGESQSARRA